MEVSKDSKPTWHAVDYVSWPTRFFTKPTPRDGSNTKPGVQYLTTLAHINRMVMKLHSVESLVMYVFTLKIKAHLPWYSVWVSFQGPHNSMGHSPWPDCKDFWS